MTSSVAFRKAVLALPVRSIQCRAEALSRRFTATTSSSSSSSSSSQPPSPGQDSLDESGSKSPSGLSATDVMQLAANRATRFVYLRTLPLAKQEALQGREREVGDAIEATTSNICDRHLNLIVDDRAAVHVHTAALAVATHRMVHGDVRDAVEVDNMIRAGFGAPLLVTRDMSDEDVLTLNDGQTMRPDYWVVRAALLFSWDKMGAVKKMTSNMVRDFGAAFETTTETDDVVGMPRHSISVTRCVYDTVCRAEGLSHLTRVFCALDRNLYAPLSVKRHGIRFRLEKTLADEEDDGDAGDKNTEQESSRGRMCRFEFLKVAK